MNSKLYGPSAQVTHSSGFAQCRRGSPVAVDGDPVRMRRPHLVARGVRIGARDDVHARARGSRRPASPNGSLSPEPRAAMVQRHLGRVVGDDAAGAEHRGVGVQAAEVVEPELRIELPRIVLDERELHPAHRRSNQPCSASPGHGAVGADWRGCGRTMGGDGGPSAAKAPAAFEKAATGQLHHGRSGSSRTATSWSRIELTRKLAQPSVTATCGRSPDTRRRMLTARAPGRTRRRT